MILNANHSFIFLTIILFLQADYLVAKQSFSQNSVSVNNI